MKTRCFTIHRHFGAKKKNYPNPWNVITEPCRGSCRYDVTSEAAAENVSIG
ncbi:MAG: hypothetical protein V1685_01275 [Parcubacteria group bacterium]